VRYGFDLWAEQVADFVADQVRSDAPERPLHLVGNSIGGIVALNTARLLQERGTPASQAVLIDCAQRTLDEKRIAELPIWEQAGRPLLKQLVRQRWLLAPLFATLARPAFIRRVLRVAYPSGANVDDELVALLHRPATDPGAVESFRGFVNLFRDHLAPDLLAQLTLPVRMIWGERDPWEAPAEARRWAAERACVRELRVLEGLGHCPHDEAPERVNPILLEWINAADPTSPETALSGPVR
jgi:pimeloyl-ACP methyl ester carboxylesterase